MGLVDNKDITVVVQGAVDREKTPICLQSIRRMLPGAFIILSTWEGTDVDGLEYDDVVLSEDPGGFDEFNIPFSPKNNINRQIVSTYQGLLKVKTVYALKLRTDFYLCDDGFKDFFNTYNRECTEYKIFEHKVICCELYSRNPRYIFSDMKRAYHPSDIFFFGYTKDLVRLFDVPLFSREDEEYMMWKYYPDNSVLTFRYDAESYLWMKLVKKSISFNEPDDLEKYGREDIDRSEATFAANLIILGNEEIGLKTLENSIYRKEAAPQNCYTHEDWERLYAFYCCNDAKEYIKYLSHVFVKNLLDIPGYLLRALLRKCRFDKRGFLTGIGKRKFDKMYAVDYYSEIIDSRDISVVVQGMVRDTTVETVRSIRQHLPYAQIVLSIFEGESADGIDADIVVKSEDPGSCGYIRKYPHEQRNNVNREIVSSRAGIEACTGKYCIKMRSDMILTGSDFLDIYNRVSKYVTTESVVSRRIMVEALSTSKSGVLNFGVSDWWYMGLRSDLLKLFSADLYKDVGKRDYKSEYRCNLTPEQYIAYSFYVNSFIPIFSGFVGLMNVTDDSSSLRKEYEKFLANNFVCVEFPISKVVLPKALYINNSAAYKYNLSYGDWLKLCRKYGTLDNVVVKRELASLGMNYKLKYKVNPDYFNILKWSSVVRNYKNTVTEEYEDTSSKVSPDEITFLVTGGIDVSSELNTVASLYSIKRFFPGASVILGTWDDETVPSYIKKLCDRICFVEKKKVPKVNLHLDDSKNEDINDINMMQTLTATAIKMVQTKYCVKMETGHVFKNSTLLDFYNYWKKIMNSYNAEYRIFDERVLFINERMYDGRNTGGKLSCAIPGTFQMGRTSDLAKIWDGHIEPDSVLRYYTTFPNTRYTNSEKYNSLYTAEQCHYINLIKNLKKKIPVPRWYEDEGSFENILAYEAVLSSNVMVGSSDDLGIMKKGGFAEDKRFISFETFLGLYIVNVDRDDKEIHDYLRNYYNANEVCKKDKEAHSILMKALIYGDRYGYDKKYTALMKKIGQV